ncbi:ABC transporter ATP-binding protein [Natronincola ferrireducens]|uniref:Branched-chain amino acid transport system ATP-binding protein n=1 Tax=Natronincola ferrireducens TaxID=393762 RepID=A0A1G8XAM1_9FIRM|nr:ABC transporter ATP-binding protein [Natronincola ferrireducens]SDJ87729.1 branched-chain amino acid transport system ATP-binding protein [Natronincola ferrireducens]
MLVVKNLNTYYGNIHALKGVSLEVKEGEIVTLIGSNGAGKSTTLGSVTGLLKTSSGEVWFKEENITNAPPSEIVKKGISLSPEGREVFPALTVEENLQLGAYIRKDKQNIAESYDRVYDLFPRLFERKKQQAGTLSGGEQQMLAIGRGLMSMPKLLLLDEPSLGLAPNLVLMIFDLIVSINQQGTTVLLVEQNANMALSIAHRGYVLETGKVTLTDDAKALSDNDMVRRAYLGNI